MDLIPRAAFVQLPFKPESMARWDVHTDLKRFLRALDSPSTVISEDGTRTVVDIPYYENDVYQWEYERLVGWAERFSRAAANAIPAPAASGRDIAPIFLEDDSFGMMGKNWVAWSAVCSTVLTESAFFSLAHALESESDLTCSIDLASMLYYKQAIQVIRNYLEDMVLTVHFCDNLSEFSAWKRGEYRVPQLRGERGVLRQLVDRKILNQATSDQVSDLYAQMNGFVHGTERRLMNRGIFNKSWMGTAFKHEDYSLWCKLFSQSVTVCIYLLAANLSQWEHSQVSGKIICSVCHADDDFDTKQYEFGSEWYTQYTCRRCGGQMTRHDV